MCCVWERERKKEKKKERGGVVVQELDMKNISRASVLIGFELRIVKLMTNGNHSEYR